MDWLKKLDTENKIDELGQNVFAVITEDNHLILEVNLDLQTKWTKKEHRQIGCAPRIQLRRCTSEGTRIIPGHWITLTVWEERFCEHCLGKIDKENRASHPGYPVHDDCWQEYIKVHPDVAAAQPPEEPLYEEEG